MKSWEEQRPEKVRELCDKGIVPMMYDFQQAEKKVNKKIESKNQTLITIEGRSAKIN